ncbi:MAG: isoprenylcysteine carboxylmethyltransferase family protein [Lutimonas sp.]
MSIRSKILLALQFLCFGYFVFFQELLATGILILVQFFGFLLCLWSIAVMGIGNFNAQPEVKPKARLVKIGPYSKIRNPMYAGLLLFFGAGLISHFNWQGLIAWVFMALIFTFKINDEEKYLTQRFGNSYADYMGSTYRMIPFVL